MATEAELEAAIAAIDLKLNDGVERVQSGDRSVQRNLTVLAKRRDDLDAELAGLRRSRLPRRFYASGGRGY